jgi:hypothetical protein
VPLREEVLRQAAELNVLVQRATVDAAGPGGGPGGMMMMGGGLRL